ncbi:PAXIP1-associated glutamate-rich protein 1-like [Montipora foliosa]|uniref:PAXIP1-associated glutamate-rich protein 1-like n=1 Tax=Montipora foliosa TaxID=591990 RepID=UPI0035F11BC0
MCDTDINEWNVPNSDDELVSCQEGHDPEEEIWDIPLKVLLLYGEIEKKGFIELKVKEYRSDPKENTVQSGTFLKEGESERANSPAEEITRGKQISDEVSATKLTIERDKTHEPSAFDYTEESIDETSHITRKIPKTERFQRKRVGTLENVISDLKRFRDMNNKDARDSDNKST